MFDTYQKFTRIGVLMMALGALVGYQFITAQTWTSAPSIPPNNNTIAPVNIGSAAQDKNGTFTANKLGSIASTPVLELIDADASQKDWRLGVEGGNSFVIRADRTNDLTPTTPIDWGNDGNHQMVLYNGADNTADYVQFSSKVRAVMYCDRKGENCSVPGDQDEAELGINIFGLARNAGFDVPLPPAAITPEWPSIIMCEATDPAGVPVALYAHVINEASGYIRYRDLTGDRRYDFNLDGSYRSREEIESNCSYDRTAGPGLVDTCTAGLCMGVDAGSICQVQLESELWNEAKTQVVSSASHIVRMRQGSSPRIGGWVECNSTTHNAYFSGITLYDKPSSATQLGWWTQENFAKYQSNFNAIQWKASGAFVANEGVTRTVELWNGCSNRHAKITATVLSCGQ